MSGEWDGLRAAAEAATAEMDRLTSAPGGPGRAWRWSIPANPERDSDLIFDEVIRHVPALLDRLQAAEAAVERVRATLADPRHRWWHTGGTECSPLYAVRDALNGPQDAATGEVALGSTDEPREPQIAIEDHERCQCCGQPSEFDVCEKCNTEMAKHPLSDDERRLLNGIGFRPSGPDGLLHLTDEEWRAGLHATAIQIAESRAKRGASGAESDHGGRGDGEGLG